MAGCELAPRAGPWRITFVTSPSRCNLRCGVCRDHSPLAPERPERDELSYDLVARVVTEQRERGLGEIIPSTRGEPLLWPALPALVSRCAELGVRVNVTTNGTFPRLGAPGWARLLAGAASDVKISWNGATAATAESLMEGLRFADAVAGVRELVAIRDELRARGERATRVTFQVTARESNVAEIPAIVSLAVALGVDRVKVNQLQVHFEVVAGEDLRRSRDARARWNAAVRESRRIAADHAAAGGAIVLENFEELADAIAAPGPCPFLGREAWVLQDGCFAPCPSPAGLGGRMGAFGSVRDRPLGEIWNGSVYRALVADYERHPVCASCPMRRPGGV